MKGRPSNSTNLFFPPEVGMCIYKKRDVYKACRRFTNGVTMSRVFFTLDDARAWLIERRVYKEELDHEVCPL